jgi:subtilisin family serine protease
MTVNLLLETSLQIAREELNQLLSDKSLSECIYQAFGDRIKVSIEEVVALIERYANADLPDIKIVPEASINFALGAFAGTNNTIYLSEEFLTANLDNPAAVSRVLLEEIGHAIDWQINNTDTQGDEGEIFASIAKRGAGAIATGAAISPTELARIRAEDDSATAYIDNSETAIEQATVGANTAFDLIGLTQMRNDSRFTGIDGSGMTVAVLDTGLDRNHSLISPNYLAGVDFVNGESNPTDRQGHGTHVSGIVGASDEDIGVATDSNLIGLKVLGDNGYGSNTDIQEALQWVLDNRQKYNIVAVNMSLGSGFYTDKSQVGWTTGINLVQQLEAAGVTVVSAA